MRPNTHKFTRDALLECARNEFKLRQEDDFCSEHERDAMEAIVFVLESYPLAKIAAEAVRVVFADLQERKGFRELLESLNDGHEMKETIIARLEKTVVYHAPIATPKTEEFDLS